MEGMTTFVGNSELFTNSHNFTINGGQFYACSGSGHGRRGSNCKDMDRYSSYTTYACELEPEVGTQDVGYGFRVIPRDELRTLSVICTRKGYRFNSAKRKGHDDLDMVQVFEGAEAKQMWHKTIEFSRCLVNAHVLAISGISSSTSSSSDPHYIVFDGAGSRNTHRVIASMLRKGDAEATVIGSRAVYGITSGLDYISQTVLPLSELRIDEIIAFSDDSGHTRLTFTPNASSHPTTVNQWSLLTARSDVEICYALITQIFKDANHMIHRDEADHHPKEELPEDLIAPRMKAHPNSETTPSGNTPQDEAIVQVTERPPRREMIWNTLGFSDLPLSYIYQNYDDLIFSNDTVQLPRRFGTAPMGYRHACSCEGYVREEITLTPDAFRNAVLIYQQPSPNERCGLCGELLWNIEEEEQADSSDSALWHWPLPENSHTQATVADSLSDGRSDSPGQELLEEELYKLRQWPPTDVDSDATTDESVANSDDSIATWPVLRPNSPDEDFDEMSASLPSPPPIPGDDDYDLFRLSPSQPMLSNRYEGSKGSNTPFSPITPAGSPYPYPFAHVRRSMSSGHSQSHSDLGRRSLEELYELRQKRPSFTGDIENQEVRHSNYGEDSGRRSVPRPLSPIDGITIAWDKDSGRRSVPRPLSPIAGITIAWD